MKEITELDDKYLVLKKEDLERFFSGYTKGVFTTDEEQKIIDNIPFKMVLEEIWNDRVANGKAGGNKYLVLNRDDKIELTYLIERLNELKKADQQKSYIKYLEKIGGVMVECKRKRHEFTVIGITIKDIVIVLVNAIKKAKEQK